MIGLPSPAFDAPRSPPLPAADENLVDTAGAIAHRRNPVTFRSVSENPSDPRSSSARDYGAFFRATLLPLRRYIARLIGSPDAAQDIAQDAYARVFTVMQDRDVEHPRALLYATARNLAIDELRHRDRSPFDHAPLDSATAALPGVEATVMAQEEARLLERAIAELPDECRRVFLLRTGEHLSHEEIAHRTGLTRKQVEKRLYRAVHLLHLAMRASGPAADQENSSPR